LTNRRTGIEWLRSLVSLLVGLVTLYLGYQFFMYSIGFLSQDPPRVTAGLMAGLAGFTFVAAAITLLRDWIIAEKAATTEGE
jgi:divalent metal cation (Fe/Co/Zn/Cd) transporter